MTGNADFRIPRRAFVSYHKYGRNYDCASGNKSSDIQGIREEVNKLNKQMGDFASFFEELKKLLK